MLGLDKLRFTEIDEAFSILHKRDPPLIQERLFVYSEPY